MEKYASWQGKSRVKIEGPRCITMTQPYFSTALTRHRSKFAEFLEIAGDTLLTLPGLARLTHVLALKICCCVPLQVYTLGLILVAQLWSSM